MNVQRKKLVPTTQAFRPVFVVGCERSGTTLLAVMLGRHSTLAMMPETHFFRLVRRGESGRSWAHEELLARFGANRTPVELGVDGQALAARFGGYPADHASLLRAVLEQYAADQGKGRAGEKTPLHLLEVERILAWFPEARVVGIVRDGRDVVLSLRAMPWAQERRIRRVSWHWVRLLRVAERWTQRYPGQFLRVRYEDLLLNPEGALRQVDGFLGMEFEAGQLNPAVATQIVDAEKEAWKAAALREVDATRIAGWKTRATPAELRMMNALMGRELKRSGYGETECRRTLGDWLACAWYRLGLHYGWERLVEKHLPGQRARRCAARQRDQGRA